MPDTRINLFDMDRPALEAWMSDLGEKPFHARQVLQWVYQKRETDFTQMSNLSKKLREALIEQAELRLPETAWASDSEDGTRKWVFEMFDGQRIETVFIPETGRGTLCVSSQVGCALDCKFCSTAQQGFNRDLSAAEIIGQVWLAAGDIGDRRITNVVMMGMGEPLLNLRNVAPALRLMTEDLAFGLGRRRVTVSTSGVVPKIDQLREQAPVSLAVSLHAPDDELRDYLVPINRKYPLQELMDACRRYLQDDARAKITFEYVMLADVNDSDHHAKALVRLMQGMPAKMNLIPFNPFPGTTYQRSTDQRIKAFQSRLQRSGLVTTVRKTRGDDIDAACGQLVGKVADRGRRGQRSSVAVEMPR